MDMIDVSNLSDYEAALVFSLLIDRAMDADKTIQAVLFTGGIIQRVFDTLDAGTSQY
jgi:hypothetical protein